jgi:hypothetical protein
VIGTAVPDIRELLGLRTIAARVIVAAYVGTYALVALRTGPPGSFWYELTAWLIVSFAAVALIAVRGDPPSIPATIALSASGAMAINLVLVVVHPPFSGLQLWPLSAATAIYTYMCVRGRAPWAWIGMGAVLISYMFWAERTGMGYFAGLQLSVINLAPLLMGTFFAWSIRPASRRIFELRRQTTMRVAAEAADTAILEERDMRLAQLDELARPLLERLASCQSLTDHDRLTARLLEAHLRDTLRASNLVTPAINSAVSRVRARGVEVVMLDDHGLDDVPAGVRDELLGHVLEALNVANAGSLTIRILPPHRDALLTIVHSTPDDIIRLVYGLDGQLARLQ